MHWLQALHRLPWETQEMDLCRNIRLFQKSSIHIVLWQCYCTVIARWNHRSVGKNEEKLKSNWVYFVLFSKFWIITKPVYHLLLCLWLLNNNYNSLPHTVMWWWLLAARSFQFVHVWSTKMLWSSSSADVTQTFRPGRGSEKPVNKHNKVSLNPKSYHVSMTEIQIIWFPLLTFVFVTSCVL